MFFYMVTNYQETKIFNLCRSATNAYDETLREVATPILSRHLGIQNLNTLTWRINSLNDNLPLPVSDVLRLYDSLLWSVWFGSILISHSIPQINVTTTWMLVLLIFWGSSKITVLQNYFGCFHLFSNVYQCVTSMCKWKGSSCGKQSCSVPSFTNSCLMDLFFSCLLPVLNFV